MQSSKASSLLAMAASMGLGLGIGQIGASSPPMLAYKTIGRRSRTPGKPRPAGSKLARQVEKRRVGIAVLR